MKMIKMKTKTKWTKLKKKYEKNEAKLKKENKGKIKFKKSYGSCRPQSMSVSLNLQYIGLYLKGSLNILVSFLERTILFRSCYVLLPLHRFKLFSKYSIYHLIIQPKYFLLVVAVMFLYAKITLFSISNIDDFVYKFCVCT